MPIDPYSPCPGGLGKKVKFCCADLIPELDKIDRMRQAEQRTACLEHVEKLDARHPGRACLMTAKADLLRELGRSSEADAAVKTLLDQHADNPVALAEAAILACGNEEGAVQGIGLLQRALAASGPTLSDKIVEALARVAEGLLVDGMFLPARAHLHLYVALHPEDKHGLELLSQLNTAPTAPLLFKERFEFQQPPEGAAWKANFDDAMQPISRGCWAQAAERLTALGKRIGNAPAIWHNLAVIQSWLADFEGASDSWRRYAALDIPEDDAVEAEAMAQLLDPKPVDEVDIVAVSYQVHDLERLTEVLLSHPQCVALPAPLTSDDPESPPPKAIFSLLDRPQGSDAGATLALTTLPRMLGQFEIYGRQTDREAHLDLLGQRLPSLDQAKAMLSGIGFGLLGPPEETVLASLPRVDLLLRGEFQLPQQLSIDRVHDLIQEHRRDVLLNQWPRLPLDLLNGQTPEQAARQPDLRTKLLAAVLNLELHCQGKLYAFDFNELRSRLGLPTPTAITVSGVDLVKLPLARLARVVVASLSDDDLSKYFLRSVTHSAVAAWRLALQAAIDRPSFKPFVSKQLAYAGLASLSDDTREALDLIDKGRNAAIADKESSARWDLQEIQIRLRRGEAAEAGRLIEHVATEHAQEPGIRDALLRIMVQTGMIRPDGTPNRAAQAAEPVAAAAAAAPEAGKIWTPDSERGGQKSGLWLPGS